MKINSPLELISLFLPIGLNAMYAFSKRKQLPECIIYPLGIGFSSVSLPISYLILPEAMGFAPDTKKNRHYFASCS